MSSLYESITYNILEDDGDKDKPSSFVVSDPFLMDSPTFIPQEETAPDTKGIPTDPSLDPLAGGYQWHLTGTWGINADEVWPDYTGQGVKVAVFDDGFDYTHTDLAPNYRTDLDFDTSGGNDNDAIAGASDRHGTAVSGVIAADDNGTGQVGVAFDSEIIGIRRSFGSGSFTDTIEGFQHALTSGADVMNNSWGATTIFVDHPTKDYFGDDTTEVISSMIDLVDQGRGGLGTSIVFSAGNSRGSDDNVNYHGYQNNPYTITVAGTDINGTIYDASTPGAAILVSATGENVTTTDGSGSSGYVPGDSVQISGTSFSAPTVSGVIALMYEANADLGYRDVQDILAMSSRQLLDSTWQTNGNTHWNGTGMHFSHDYGYGLVDAYTAVRLAETWTEQKTYANMETISTLGTPNIAIPDNSTLNHIITVSGDIEIEHILLDLVVPHQRAGDLIVTLVSPDGTESILVETAGNGSLITDAHGYTGLNFQFTSTGHWGETSAGDWTLRIEDTQLGNTGTLESFNLQFLGSTISNNDTYYFTDEFQGTVITDAGGIDAFNLAPVRGDVTIVMAEGGSSTVAGQTLRTSNTTMIENVTLGDGNDAVTGNDANNIILTGRGNDNIFNSNGDDTIDGQAGLDTINYSGNLSDYTVEFLDPITVRITDNVGGAGVDTVQNLETFVFNDGTFTFIELEAVVAEPIPADPLLFKLGWDGNTANYVSNLIENVTLTAGGLGISDATGDLLTLNRISGGSGALTILDPAAQDIESLTLNYASAFNLTLSGAKTTNIHLGSVTSSFVQLTDTMNGRIETGDGSDTINIQLSEIIAPIAIEDYRLIGNGGNDSLTVSGTHSNIRVTAFGGSGNDTITVSVAGDHFLYGELGDDIINGSSGNERIEGGVGSDQVNAGAGIDVVYGGDDNDTLNAGLGDDWLYGDGGSDVLNGDGGNDNMRGGIGGDVLNGGDGNDTLYGEDGNDLLNGDGGRDILIGGDGDDTINGGEWHDLIYGDAGIDTINGGVGNDEIRGGDGNDIINGGDGIDKILAGLDNDTVHGDAGGDRIYGEDGDDTLYGDDGNDVLYGGNGNDILIGGVGQDFLYGGAGVDTFFLDLNNIDRVKDFKLSDGDRIDISDLLVGYDVLTDDINNFVKITIQSNFRTDVSVNLDGAGNDFQYVGILYGNLTGQTVDMLETNNNLIA